MTDADEPGDAPLGGSGEQESPSAEPSGPEPGSAEWLLGQLSGGRITSRRERREVEAALETAGVEVPVPSAPSAPPASPVPPVVAAPSTAETDAEKPKARFSWETGQLEERPAPEASSPSAAEPAPAPILASQPARPEPAAPSEPQGGDDSIPFMWNLSPTDEPDPAVNPHAAQPEAPAELPPSYLSAAPLVIPRMIVPPAAPSAPAAPASPAESAPEPERSVEPEPAVAAAPAEPAAPDSGVSGIGASEPAEAPFAAPIPAVRAPQPAAPQPGAPEPPEPTALESAAPEWTAPEPAAPEPAAPEPMTRAPEVPGTVAHPFDPFAQDLFAPAPAASTPIPSIDEFTMPDEPAPTPGATPTGAAVPEPESAEPAAPSSGTHITSDWSDIADMFGSAPPVTEETTVLPAGAEPGGAEPGGAASGNAALGSAAPDRAARGVAEAAAPAPASVFPPPAASPRAPAYEGTAAFEAALLPSSAPTAAPSPGPFALGVQPPARPPAPEHTRRGGGANRWLIVVAAILAAVLIAIGLFELGRAVAAGRSGNGSSSDDRSAALTSHSTSPSPTPSSPAPSPTPTQTVEPAATGPLAVGQSYAWDQLRGGECIDPFSTPWAQDFSVVDCAAPHAAQLVYMAPYSSDPAAAFPGVQAIGSQINLLCSKPGVIDLSKAAAYNDVQLVASYPVTQEQWAAGQRNYYCFVSRQSGQPLSSSVAGPGPTQ